MQQANARLGRIVALVDAVIEHVTTALFTGLVLLVIAQVLIRYIGVYFVAVASPWTEEIARYLLVLVTFLGGAICIRHWEHIAITTLPDLLPPKYRRWLDLALALTMLVFLMLTLQGAAGMTERNWSVPSASVSWLRTGHVYLGISIGVVLMIYYTLRHVARLIFAAKEG